MGNTERGIDFKHRSHDECHFPFVATEDFGKMLRKHHQCRADNDEQGTEFLLPEQTSQHEIPPVIALEHLHTAETECTNGKAQCSKMGNLGYHGHDGTCHKKQSADLEDKVLDFHE